MSYHLKIAFRNLRRNGLYSAINVAGLTVSITACILIMLWALDEWNFDRFYHRADDIYAVISHDTKNGIEEYMDFTVVPLARAAKENLPDVETSCSFGWSWEIGYLEYENQKYISSAGDYVLADSSFFSVFDMEFVEGDAMRAFPDAQSVVITDELSRIIFGNESAMGKMLKGSNGKNYHVSAVVKKPRQNSMLQFKAMFSFEQSVRNNNWYQWASRCFLKLRPGADPVKVGAQLLETHQRNVPDYSPAFPYLLHPITKYHLYAPDGSATGMKKVRLFVLIAIALLTIACINYVNLVTARMHKRMKEISLRKIVGAKKLQLFMQMMSESMLLFFVSLMIAQVALWVVMPQFCMVTGKQVIFNPFHVQFLMLYLLVFVFVSVLAGLYPAVALASFKPLDIFRKTVETRSATFLLSFRRMLTVSQFACSVALIFATIVISMQQRFMSTKDMGFNRENVLTCTMPLNQPSHSFEAFRNELLQHPEIAGVTASQGNIMNLAQASDLQWRGKPEDLTVRTVFMGIDRDFMETLGIELLAGRGFTGTPADSLYYFLNETAVKQMGIADPLNITVSLWPLPEGQVAGIVKDFHFRHMTETVGPMLLYLPHSCWTVYIKSVAGKTREALAVSERIWKNHYPDYPFDYTFMDDTFASMYTNDIRTGRLFNAFAVIAIFVSCLGLFGLVTFTAASKTRETGIRKVLGASVASIVMMLSIEFLILVGVAMLIAFPLAYYWLDRMLQDYAYRIEIQWWMFALTGIITIVLTLITVGWQAIKAATANPVKAIKSE